MALPAIADVRRTWPDARLSVAARPSIAPLFSLVPDVNDIVVLPRGGASAAAAALAPHSFDAAILLPNSFQIALAARRAGIPERWGYRADWRGPLLTRGVTRPERVHQAEYYQRLVAAVGCANGPMRPRLDASNELRARGEALLASAGWNRGARLVAFAPGAAYGGAKRWPAESFAAAAGALSNAGAVQIVLIGASGDRAAGAEVAGSLPPTSVVNLIGQTDLPALAGVLAATRGLVTNDSGAMHFAAALGIPVTAMFGPTREAETRPLSSSAAVDPVVLTHEVWCRPCMLRECPLTHRCMRGITVDAVVAAARRAL